MKGTIIGGIAIISILLGLYFYVQHRNDLRETEIAEAIELKERQKIEKKQLEWKMTFDRAKSKADSAKVFCEENKLRTDYCILVDFEIHSGKNRLFVWDFAKDTIVDASLCCHGYGNEKNRSSQTNITFSNVEGSLCSSLGRFKTAYRDKCSYGVLYQYRIDGLDETNDNALRRFVTLHSYGAVPDEEIYPEHLPLGYSQGCFVIPDKMLNRLDKLMKISNKQVLIWSYYN